MRVGAGLSLRAQLLLIAVGGFIVGHFLTWVMAQGLRQLHGGGHFILPVSIATFAALVVGVGWLAARVTRPLKRLTEAAEGFSGSGPLAPIEAEGPPDMQRAIEAFNGMSARISGLLDEKDQMLGALGHDLRTPLTSIRIRAAGMQPVKARTAVFASVDGMERMIDDILTLARTGRSAEPVRMVDVRRLMLEVVEEFRAQGADVDVAPGEAVTWPLRPDLLTRAIRNLTDNAVRYGGNARLGAAVKARGLVITVEDDGPGVPEEDLEAVLRPFSRLDTSRNSQTGGAGLGLAIAVSVARLHGGDVELGNRPEGGLAATLWLKGAPD